MALISPLVHPSQLSNIMPLVKKHREDLKAATVVAGERFRTQALAQVQATLQAAGPAARDSTQTNTDLFFVWYCAFLTARKALLSRVDP